MPAPPSRGATAWHRRPAPRLSAELRPKSRRRLRPVRTLAAPSSRAHPLAELRTCIHRGTAATACTCLLASQRQPARQAPPSRSLGERLRPLIPASGPLPCIDRADATDASTLAAGWACPPPAPSNYHPEPAGSGLPSTVRPATALPRTEPPPPTLPRRPWPDRASGRSCAAGAL